MENENKGFTPQAPSHPCHYGEECSCNKAENESCSNEKITTSNNMEEFAKELTSLINKHCVENETNTPDFILSDYLMNCLEAYHSLNIKKEVWKNN